MKSSKLLHFIYIEMVRTCLCVCASGRELHTRTPAKKRPSHCRALHSFLYPKHLNINTLSVPDLLCLCVCVCVYWCSSCSSFFLRLRTICFVFNPAKKKKASPGYRLQLQLQLHPASLVALCGSFNVISRINFDIVILRFACFFSFAFTVFAFAIFYFSLRTFIALLACAFSSLFDFNNVASSQFLLSSANFASTTAGYSAAPHSLPSLHRSLSFPV